MAKRVKVSTPVEAVKHKDKRANIPTHELRDFVAEDEKTPKQILYPRDPSLDPQLVWKGKDEQDREDLVVPALPIYIQEKIQPKVLIENLRETAKAGEEEPELRLFDDFNGIEFEDLIDFYQHEQNWSNRMILGDSLTVITSLAEKEGLKGKVQMIYVDPPYGIKFGSNWQVSTRKSQVVDGKAADATRQPEQIRAFRDTWQLGIHSYLSYLRDRLVVARELLTESGSIFVQISDENLHLVRSMLDEIFGSENYIVQFVFQKKGSQSGDFVPPINEYIVWYAKNIDNAKFRPLYVPRDISGVGGSGFDNVELPNGSARPLSPAEEENPQLLPSGTRVFSSNPLFSQKSGPNDPVKINNQLYPSGGNSWKISPSAIPKLHTIGRILVTGTRLRFKRYADDFGFVPLSNIWMGLGGASDKIFVVQTNVEVVKRCVLMTTDPGDLIVDPTCGSGTAAYVAEQWGRRWITIDTSRVALALARTRLMTARYPYYLLADSTDGLEKTMEITGQVAAAAVIDNDIKKGFVYKRVPHVTLKSIANNPDIKEGMNKEEIETAIARHADSELLYDQPYEDSKRVRVTGPFTVESLSPHRVLSEDSDRPSSEETAEREDSVGQFESMILENLKKAGVQNTVKNERLVFDRLESYAGTWLHAEGEFTDKDDKSHRVAVSIGPEHGTVGPEQVKEAAKEAVQGVGFDVLIVCGFAFDPHVSEESKRYGKLTVLPTHMNPDLSMGDELLKKTGAANLFMVFGEPDLDVIKENGKVAVEIRGVDVYDPTTGEIRSSSTEDIACWFIDTNYNGESFFVRHAYFTGADEPYEKLKKALKSEIDEAAWLSLYSTKSRPFDAPATGKIAIKVINHYGDEVLKVYDAQELQ